MFRLVSLHLPAEFPFQRNWKMSETHPAFWELTPTTDHIMPIARGGAVQELGWSLHPPGEIAEWDGLTGWFRSHVRENQKYLENTYIRTWYRALQRVAAV